MIPFIVAAENNFPMHNVARNIAFTSLLYFYAVLGNNNESLLIKFHNSKQQPPARSISLEFHSRFHLDHEFTFL